MSVGLDRWKGFNIERFGWAGYSQCLEDTISDITLVSQCRNDALVIKYSQADWGNSFGLHIDRGKAAK